MEALDHVIPISVLVSRMEKHRDQLRLDLAVLPWWRIKRRATLSGAIATYGIEIEALLEIGGRSQPIWSQLPAARKAT